MIFSRVSLWLVWAVLVSSLAAWLALPRFVAPRPDPWNAAETAVAGFVLAILALVAGVWTFALRESLLRDTRRAMELRADGEYEAPPRAGRRPFDAQLWLARHLPPQGRDETSEQ